MSLLGPQAAAAASRFLVGLCVSANSWLALASSSPGSSLEATSAASNCVAACSHGDGNNDETSSFAGMSLLQTSVRLDQRGADSEVDTLAFATGTVLFAPPVLPSLRDIASKEVPATSWLTAIEQPALLPEETGQHQLKQQQLLLQEHHHSEHFAVKEVPATSWLTAVEQPPLRPEEKQQLQLKQQQMQQEHHHQSEQQHHLEALATNAAERATFDQPAQLTTGTGVASVAKAAALQEHVVSRRKKWKDGESSQRRDLVAIVFMIIWVLVWGIACYFTHGSKSSAHMDG